MWKGQAAACPEALSDGSGISCPLLPILQTGAVVEIAATGDIMMISALSRLKRIIPSSALGPCPLIRTNWSILRGKKESKALSSRNQSKCFVLVISPLELVWVVQGCAGALSSEKSTSQALGVA